MAISAKCAFVSQSPGSAKPHYVDHQTARSLDGDPVYEWRNGGAVKARAVYRSAITGFALQFDRIEEFTLGAGITFGHAVSGVSFAGDGSGLTALNASNLGSGTVPDARISGAYTGITTLSMSGQLTSTVVTGTAPFAISSTTVVTNLNADLLDGNHASAFATASHTHATSDVTSGTFADARIAQSNVTQHQGALTIAASQIGSGTVASARVSGSYTGITAVGTLSTLTVSGAVNLLESGIRNWSLDVSASGTLVFRDTSGAVDRLTVDTSGAFALNGTASVIDLLQIQSSAATLYTTLKNAPGRDLRIDIHGNSTTDALVFRHSPDNEATYNEVARFNASGAIFDAVTAGAVTATSLNLGGATVTDILTALFLWDPPSIAADSEVSTTVTVTGAATGDPVFISNDYGSNLIMQARVSSADTVEIRLRNTTSSAINPVSSQSRIVVMKF